MSEQTHTLERFQAITVLESLCVAIRKYDTLLRQTQDEETIWCLTTVRNNFVNVHNEIATTFGYPSVQ